FLIMPPPFDLPLSLHDALPIWLRRCAELLQQPGFERAALVHLERVEPGHVGAPAALGDGLDHRAAAHGPARRIGAYDEAVPACGERKSTRLNPSHQISSQALFC